MRRVSSIDFGSFDALTFDCYGTLIDWEAGILAALRPLVGGAAGDEPLLEAFARHEARLEAGPYLPLRRGAGRLPARPRRGAGLRADRGASRPRSAPRSRTGRRSPTAPQALARLKQRFKLGVITNCDDDLFAASNRRLGVEFDWVITAAAGTRLQAAPGELRVRVRAHRRARGSGSCTSPSRSFTTTCPAKALGMTSVWIDRRQGRAGGGATPPASATPDLTTPDLKTFADLVT